MGNSTWTAKELDVIEEFLEAGKSNSIDCIATSILEHNGLPNRSLGAIRSKLYRVKQEKAEKSSKASETLSGPVVGNLADYLHMLVNRTEQELDILRAVLDEVKLLEDWAVDFAAIRSRIERHTVDSNGLVVSIQGKDAAATEEY